MRWLTLFGIGSIMALPAACAWADPSPGLVVHTSAGTVSGAEIGAGIIAFKGIPYAAPPVGRLRWRPPQPPVPWSGTRDASHFGDDCMQTPYVIPTGQKASEDCLTVSLWTTPNYRKTRSPVMVFIYGGAFIGGSAAYPLYDGAKLVREGAVVVGFNYRVGIFGLLAHPELSAESPQHTSGNYSLLDQVAALKWVKTNIAAFGGDPGRITVFGESAGAVSIAVLMTSSLAKGLFERAILQSPTLPPLASLAAAEKAGAAVDPQIAALRQLSAAELLAHNDGFFPRSNEHGVRLTAFPAPIVDGYLVPEQPRAVFEKGASNTVPLIVGINADEGRMFSGEGATAATSAAVGDATFVESARWIARGASQHQPKVFAYVFTRSVAGGPLPPTHSEELPFVFGSLEQPSFIKHPAPAADDVRLSGLMMRIWTRFAATGDPNGPGLPNWPHYERTTDPYLEFGTVTRAGAAFRKKQLDVIDQDE